MHPAMHSSRYPAATQASSMHTSTHSVLQSASSVLRPSIGHMLNCSAPRPGSSELDKMKVYSCGGTSTWKPQYKGYNSKERKTAFDCSKSVPYLPQGLCNGCGQRLLLLGRPWTHGEAALQQHA
jgi:hypothetical protein